MRPSSDTGWWSDRLSRQTWSLISQRDNMPFLNGFWPRPNNGLQADGGTAVVCDSVLQARVGDGSAPAAEAWAFGENKDSTCSMIRKR